ncbi:MULTISPECIES: PD-(D/E)XK nuclease-like domain-containing protein [Yersinia]|uniref:PD-(D/E)XK nuclease-like domain-containing protein n=1 Tax=Yersinia TaxID=629 RepID=UPI0005E15F8A|nr:MULTISPECIES: PD-(D/E)XK nuclease-like domain-containing protein [Yersinia]CNI10720.1 Exodeoxyribonuclease 8 [Yersinia frederiksenii]EKN6241268.1 exodeoxyribonuclease VIII [Yersinia enterocolitica]EKN6262894.1 exodeoxyribonuclease VIII [Yersinia enterocolitica]MCB5324490.1 PD-(D/E)XK nuclease-like domain-containing protein [Yersinia intermedia]UXD30558.1 putative recet [Yersinia enterocolitica]
MEPGHYQDISNEDYHSGPGVSKSQLDDVAINPAILTWKKTAPVDTEKLKALDMGTALHCLLLEPDEFDKRFIKAPEFNRRTTDGKAAEKDFLKECEESGKTVMDFEQHRKLELMQGSAMAHPAARYFLEAEGYCESSIYWTDEETSELCRIRPDKFLTSQPIIVDVKKVADMDRFSRHIEEFRYHVQDAMYRDGYLNHFNEYPTFLFIAVSETINCGRYPTRVFQLDADDVAAGHDLYRKNLQTYHECRLSNEWGGVETIYRPAWARKKNND